MKKNLSVVLLLAITGLVFASCEGEKKQSTGKSIKAQESVPTNPSTDFKYDLTEDGSGIIIQKYVAKGNLKVKVPDTIEGYPVTEIGDNAFLVSTGIETDNWYWSNANKDWKKINKSFEYIYIPRTVTKVGYRAFGTLGTVEDENKNLVERGIKSLDIDISKLTYIGNEAFDGCNFTNTDIVINKNVSGIDERNIYLDDPLRVYVFRGTNVTSVIFEDGLKNISENMFENCKNLKSVTIPASVKMIGFFAFHNCESLESVTFGEGAKIKYGRYDDAVVFTECPRLTLAVKQTIKNTGYTETF